MDLKSLQKQLARLTREKQAYQAQNKLFENLIEMARSCSESQMLRFSMRKTLDLASELAGAEKGSLLLLNERGTVTDSILSREKVNSGTRSKLIGRVLDKGLAGWVKKNLEVGLVEDAETDSRWLSLPDQPYTVRSALAVPIMRRRFLFGILTLMHSEPGRFKKEAVDIVRMTADQMALAIENAKLYVELAKAKMDVEGYSMALRRELEKGRRIQLDFLPKHLPETKELEIAAGFRPALQVSGDFYDVFHLPGGLLGVLVGDVSGKGVGAGLFMALIRSFIRIFAQWSSSGRIETAPGAVSSRRGTARTPALDAVDITNDYIVREHGEEGMFATLFFGVLNPGNGLIQYINAGHEPVYVFGEGQRTRGLWPCGPAVGVMEDIEYECGRISLAPGAILFGYTDGVTEARSPTGEMFTRSRLESLIHQTCWKSSGEFVEQIQNSLACFIGGAPQHDDITMLAIRRRA